MVVALFTDIINEQHWNPMIKNLKIQHCSPEFQSYSTDYEFKLVTKKEAGFSGSFDNFIWNKYGHIFITRQRNKYSHGNKFS